MQPDLHFDRLPALLPRYLKGLVHGRSPDRYGGTEIAATVAEADAVGIDRNRLARFRSLLRYPDDGLLPPTYPQVLAAPLHLSLLTGPGFPLRPTGLVHLENTITVQRGIDESQPLQLAARLSGHAAPGRDIEIELATTAAVDGEIVWRASSKLLARRKGTRQRGGRVQRSCGDQAREITRWRATTNIGRSYARVSGDYNPIHLSSVTARPFGFASAIAHGMWSLGRAVSGLHALLDPPFRIAAVFRRPLLLPAEVRLMVDPQSRFRVEDTTSGKAYLEGALSRSPAEMS